MLRGRQHNVVTILLYHDCIRLVGTTLRQYQQGCYKLLTACCMFVDNLGQAVRTQLVDGLLADLLQAVRFLRVYHKLTHAAKRTKLSYI